MSVETSPEGAEVYVRAYGVDGVDWRFLGTTPIDVRVPRELLFWKLEKSGYETVEAASGSSTLSRTLDALGMLPPGMVRADDRSAPFFDFDGLTHLERVRLEPFLIDKYEVTNREFKKFVDSGAYQEREYWKQDFVRNGAVLSWEEAMAEFTDQTGRPGPAGWELGSYPEGEDELPVTGVSWYEAAAYAEFAGKALPTIFHWAAAAGASLSEFIVPVSNFDGIGASPGGTFRNPSPVGAYDMAGNVKEWCWNEIHTGRLLLGGAWNEPAYSMNQADGQDAFERGPTFGFRCMKTLPESDVPEAAARRPVERLERDFAAVVPASDEVFEIYRRLFVYDRTELEPNLEWKHEDHRHWTRERVTVEAAYGDEKLAVYLFLPRRGEPPYQTVIYFPGTGSLNQSSGAIENGPIVRSGLSGMVGGMDFVLKSGRALVVPVYKGTWERRDDFESAFPDTTASYRDHLVMWGKDIGRAIDYIETRPELNDQIAFYGASWGGEPGRDPSCGGDALQRERPRIRRFLPQCLASRGGPRSLRAAGNGSDSHAQRASRLHLPAGNVAAADVRATRDTGRAQTASPVRFLPHLATQRSDQRSARLARQVSRPRFLSERRRSVFPADSAVRVRHSDAMRSGPRNRALERQQRQQQGLLMDPSCRMRFRRTSMNSGTH